MATLTRSMGTSALDSGGERRRATGWPEQTTAPRAQTQRRLPPRRRRHSGDDHEGQQRPGVPRGGATRRGAHACDGRGQEGSGAGVLCGGDAGYAEVGDGGGWGMVDLG